MSMVQKSMAKTERPVVFFHPGDEHAGRVRQIMQTAFQEFRKGTFWQGRRPPKVESIYDMRVAKIENTAVPVYVIAPRGVSFGNVLYFDDQHFRIPFQQLEYTRVEGLHAHVAPSIDSNQHGLTIDPGFMFVHQLAHSTDHAGTFKASVAGILDTGEVIESITPHNPVHFGVIFAGTEASIHYQPHGVTKPYSGCLILGPDTRFINNR